MRRHRSCAARLLRHRQSAHQRVERHLAPQAATQIFVHCPGSSKSNSKATRAFPWWLLRLASAFVTTLREMMEMRYLWRQPVRMSNAHLTAVFGHEPHTPLDEAAHATLAGLGCVSGA
jgi:hypothetical protein